MRNFTKRLLVLALLLVPMWGVAQVLVSQYAMESGVNASKWVTLPSDATTLITNGGNSRASSVQNIGFTFMFGGVNYTQFSVNTDGNFKFGATATGTGGHTMPFGFNNVLVDVPKINGFGCNGDMSDGGYAKCAVMGAAPNRKLVVEYNVAEYSWFSSSPDIKWQVQLFEGSNEVMLVYCPTAPEDAPSEFQIGMATGRDDVLTVNTVSGSVSTGTSELLQSRWPVANTYYRFYQPTCIRPSGLTITSMVADMVNFSWTAGEGQTSWQYACVLSGVSVDWTLAETVNMTTGSVAGLLPNSDYELYVRTDCGGGDYSDASVMAFHTGCVPENAPYNEDFEGYEEDEIPGCWTSHNNESRIVNNSVYYETAHMGEGCMVMGCMDTMVAPLVKLPANQMTLTIWIKSEDIAAGTIDIGYATTASATDFVAVRNIAPLSTNYEEYVVDFSATGVTDTVYVVLRHNMTDIDCFYLFYIDDVKIEQSSTCPRPGFAYTRNVDHHAATVVWSPNDEVMGYEVAYGTTDTIANARREMVMGGVDSLRIENLNSNTKYYAWVRNVCDVDSSIWRDVEPFYTMSSCAMVKNMVATSITTTTASVSWAIDHSYGEEATAVEFSYKRIDDTGWSSPVVLTNQNYYILQNLESGYTYEARVKTQCGTDTSSYATVIFVTESCGTIVEGDGESFTHYVPFGGMYKNVYSQMIYPATRLTGVDTIRGIALHVDDVEGTEMRLVDVYLQNSSNAVLNLAHTIDMASVTKVATDAVVVVNEGWVSIMFDTVFVYDGTSNLGVVIYDHSGHEGEFIYVLTNSYGNTLYKRSDGAILNSETANVTGMSTLDKMPDMRFISECPAAECVPPTIAFEQIGNDAISIRWVAGANENRWVVAYKAANESTWISDTVSVQNYTFSGLLSGTRYEIRVGAICGSATVYTTITATTDCMAFDLPFVENFDNEVLECWTKGGSGYAEVVWTNEMGSGMLDYGFYGGAYVITPAINAPINSLQTSFKLGSSSFYSDGALVVSVGDSPENLASFVSVDTIVVPMESALASQLVSFENYSGGGRYIMFSSFTGEVYLDEIRIEEIPQCSMPSNLQASQITDSSATITWTDNGTMVDRWRVTYRKTTDNHRHSYEVDYNDGASYTITGLEANTEYQVSVATICTTDDTTETLYPITFFTNCGRVKIPYFEGFEDEIPTQYHNCWYRDVPTVTQNHDLRFEGIRVPSVYVGEGSGNTLILGDNKSIASPLIPLSANEISVNFDMKVHDAVYSGDLIVGFTNNPNNLNSMVPVDTLSIDVTTWNNYTVNFNNINRLDTGYVVFKNLNNRFNGSGWNEAYYYIWLDNINFSRYSTCMRPSNGSISNITATTATVTFSDAGSSNNYTIAWNTAMELEGADTMHVSTTTAQLNNLQSSTQYHVWVRSNCSATLHSAWIYAGTFRTDCNAMTMPYVENFNDYFYGIATNETRPSLYPNHAMPNCWEVIGMSRTGADPIVMISNYPDYAVDSNTLYAEASRTKKLFMVLPAFEPVTDSLLLTFSYRLKTVHDVAGEFMMGVMTSPTDTTTFIPLEDLPSVTEMTTLDHAFAYDTMLDATQHYFIAFRFGGAGAYQSLGLDNVKVEYAPSCLHPIELAITRVGMNSAQASWRGLSNSYEVQYRLADGASDWTAVTSATNSVTLNNLTASSRYELRVKGICGSNDQSTWSRSIYFTTLCAAVDLPWSENFDTYSMDVSGGSLRPDSYPNHVMPECWTFAPMSMVFNGTPAAWLTIEPNDNHIHYNSISGVSLRLFSDVNAPMYAALPAVNASIDTVMLSFDYVMSRYAAPLVLGVMTDPNDYSTFQPLQTYEVTDSVHSVEHYFLFDEGLNPSETYYIAFDAGNANGKITTLDNIVVDYMPSCIRPGNVKNLATTHDQTHITWASTSNTAQVLYRKAIASTWVDTIVHADTIVLNNLTYSTNYEVLVRSICGNGDSSAWSDTLRFATECEPYMLPFNETFTDIEFMDELNCWSFYRGNVNAMLAHLATWRPIASTDTKWKHNTNTSHSTLGSVINICDNNRNEWMVTPQLSILPNAAMSFDVAFMNYWDPIPADDFADDKFYVMATTDNGSSWTKLITWGSDATDDYPMDSLTVAIQTKSVSLSQFAGQTIRIAFYAESNTDNGDNNLFLGNISIDGSPCAEPTDTAVTVTAIDATLSWNGGSQTYEISLRESSNPIWSNPRSVTATSHTFTGLMPQTEYAYRLRTVCAEGVYSHWVEGQFTTLDLPCEKPIVAVTNPTNNGATFSWQQGTNHAEWEVNVFNPIFDTTIDVTQTTYTITGLVVATEYYVAVRAKCAENVYSDWSDTLIFSTIDCLPVTEVTASDITQHTAVITWRAGATETEWVVNYGLHGFSSDEGIFEMVNATNYTINGLDPETEYDVYVRALCGEDFYSVWSQKATFTTLASQEGIDGVAGNFQFNIYPNPTSNATTISLNGVEGKVVISVVDMNGRTVANEAIECGIDCEKRIDVTNLAQGTYFVRVLGDNINSVRKLIVR